MVKNCPLHTPPYTAVILAQHSWSFQPSPAMVTNPFQTKVNHLIVLLLSSDSRQIDSKLF